MSTLHRTQIYIGEEEICRLKLEAEKERVPVSELIRRAIQAFLESEAESADWKRDPLTRAIGKIKLTVDDASLRHDDYLYGEKQ